MQLNLEFGVLNSQFVILNSPPPTPGLWEGGWEFKIENRSMGRLGGKSEIRNSKSEIQGRVGGNSELRTPNLKCCSSVYLGDDAILSLVSGAVTGSSNSARMSPLWKHSWERG